MRRILEWLAVNAFLVALNVVFALSFLGLGMLAKRFSPEVPLIGYVIGAVCLVLTLWLARLVMGRRG